MHISPKEHSIKAGRVASTGRLEGKAQKAEIALCSKRSAVVLAKNDNPAAYIRLCG